MSITTLIVLFNVIYLFTNVLYLELIERIFDKKNSKTKIFLFGVISSLSGTVLLFSFGSMSALGYFIMLVFYTIMVFAFYRSTSKTTRICCALFFNLHIMFSRAIITAILSFASGETFYEISSDPEIFWWVLVTTTILTALINLAMLKILPRKYLKLLGKKSEALIVFLLLLILANIYMIVNGNVYIHDIGYSWLALHQVVAAFVSLFTGYVGVFSLIGFDMLKEHRQIIAQDAIYKQVVESRSIYIIEINCTKDRVTKYIENSETMPIQDVSYSEFYEKKVRGFVVEDDQEIIADNISLANILENFKNDKFESSAEFRLVHDDGDCYWVRSIVSTKKDPESDDVLAIIAILDDINDMKSIQHTAQLDSLVGAYNKKATEMHIKDYLNENNQGVFFMIDLDNFKSINDTFGHSYGDDVLKNVHASIAKNFRTQDIVGRIGGDEFVVFLTGGVDESKIIQKAQALCKAINREYTQKNLAIEISCSVGVAISPEHGRTFEELYYKADLAMYSCKKKTKNGYVIYTADIES